MKHEWLLHDAQRSYGRQPMISDAKRMMSFHAMGRDEDDHGLLTFFLVCSSAGRVSLLYITRSNMNDDDIITDEDLL